MKKISMFILVSIAVFLFNQTGYGQDKILAVVNNEIITQKDFQDFTNFMRMQLSQEFKGEALEEKLESIKDDMLEKLIEDKLILQAAKKEDIQVDEHHVTSKMVQIKSRYTSEIEFLDALKMQGITQADLETKIREQILVFNTVESNVRSKVIVTPQEVTNFYTEHINEFIQPETRQVSSISTDDFNTANKARAALNNKGAELLKVAEEFGLTVNNHGEVAQGEFKQEIESQIFGLGVNEVSKLVKFEGQFYIFKVGKIVPPRQLDLCETSDEIYSYLYEKQIQERLSEWLNELKKKSYIEIKQG